MKNHKLFLIILFISVIINPNFGQKGSWTIGLNSGLRGELFDASQHYRLYFFGNKISFPPIEFNLAYGINDNFFIETGITYIETKTNWGFGAIDWGMEGTYCAQYKLYSSLQLPINLKYNLPIFHSRFHLFTKVGLNIQIVQENYELETNCSEPYIIQEMFVAICNN